MRKSVRMNNFEQIRGAFVDIKQMCWIRTPTICNVVYKLWHFSGELVCMHKETTLSVDYYNTLRKNK